VGSNAGRGGDGGAEGTGEEVGGWRARVHLKEAQKRLAALLKGVELATGEILLARPYSHASHKLFVLVLVLSNL
jgi:hypothetical protein